MSGMPLRYTPPGPVASRFMASQARVRLIIGPIGSGKTTTCIFDPLQKIRLQKPGTVSGIRRVRWAAIRNTYPELKTTTIKSWHQWVPPTLGTWQSEGPPTHTVPLDLGNGDRAEFEMLFLAMDREEDVRKLLSLELTGAWLNEMRELPWAIMKHVRGRIGRYPPKNDGGATWYGIIGDTNPPDTESDIYRVFEEEQPKGFELYRQPSGRSPQAENLANLPSGYYQELLDGQGDDWVRVYVDGLYGFSRDGKPVYPEFNDSLHVSGEDLKPHPKLPLIIGADAGLTPAAIVTQHMPDGQWRILDEIVSDNMGGKRFGELVNQVLAERYAKMPVVGWADPAANARSPNDEIAWVEIFSSAAKLKFKGAPTNDLVPRLEAVRQPLARLIDGKPGLLLSPRCRVLRKGFNSGYHFRRIATSGGTKFDERPDKNEFSHPHDALQYALLGGGEYAEVTGRAERRRQAAAHAPVEADGDYDPMRW